MTRVEEIEGMRSLAKLAAATERIALLLELQAVEGQDGRGDWPERAAVLRTRLWGARHAAREVHERDGASERKLVAAL